VPDAEGKGMARRNLVLIFLLCILRSVSLSGVGDPLDRLHINTTMCNGPPVGVAGTTLLQLRTRRSSLNLGATTEARSKAHAGASHATFVGGLHRALTGLEISRNVSNTELDNLITRFMNHHAADADKCPAKLMEAKHQMNNLHKAINDLADLINTTEGDLHVVNDELKDTLGKIKDIEDEKEKDTTKATVDKKDNGEMLATLRKEMEEMRQIAQPSVSISDLNDPDNAKINTDGGPVSLLQVANAAKSPESEGGDGQKVSVVQAQTLVTHTRDAASAMMSCYLQLRQQQAESQRQLVLAQGNSALGLEAIPAPVTSLGETSIEVTSGSDGPVRMVNCSVNTTVTAEVDKKTSTIKFGREVANGTAGYYHCSKVNEGYGGVLMLHCHMGKLTADARGCIPLADEKTCEKQKEQLEDTYVQAYVELARLIKEYEDLAEEEGPLSDGAKAMNAAKEEPLQDKADKLAAEQEEKLRQLEELRPRLEDMILAEQKLRDHIKDLSEKCQQLPDTESGLQKVREAIRALEACPGIGRAQFRIPKFTGEWVEITQDSKKSDKDNDAAALQACIAKYGKDKGVRVAEVSEILAHSVEGMPLTNTAPVALLGACPYCEGDDDSATSKTNLAGHSRICWDAGVKLVRATRRKDCSMGQKAVMCVYDRGDLNSKNLKDRGDIRKAKEWPFTTPLPSTTQGSAFLSLTDIPIAPRTGTSVAPAIAAETVRLVEATTTTVDDPELA